MRVAAYLHNYPPGRLLGGELMTSILLEALVEAGHDVTVICYEAPVPRERNGVHIVPRRKMMLGEDMAGFDVFISHPEVAGFARNRVGDAPFVSIVHNLNPPTIDALRITRAHLVVANAQATLDRVKSLGRQSMIVHPPTLVDRHPLPPGVTGSFATLVNLCPEKGGDLFYELAAARPHRSFLGVTGGYGEQVFKDRRPSNVYLLGQSESMGVVYAATKVLLFPSQTETYGMVAAEACIAGIPVIAHPLPGVREALGDAATWVDRDDIDGWLDALDALDQHEEWLLAAGKATDRGRFLARRTSADIARFVAAVEGLALK